MLAIHQPIPGESGQFRDRQGGLEIDRRVAQFLHFASLPGLERTAETSKSCSVYARNRAEASGEKPTLGFEPRTCSLRESCATTVLFQHGQNHREIIAEGGGIVNMSRCVAQERY